jgi:uncharacterized protein YjbI with pentapeptide repeats
MLLGPTVLIGLRIYLQFYVEHEHRLNRIARWISAARAPTLAPDRIPLMRAFSGSAFYLLLPLVMLAFFWKAAVVPDLGTALLVVAAAVVAVHLLLPLRRLSWGRRAVLSMVAATLAGGAVISFGPWQRPFNLFRANLSDQWLTEVNLKGANLEYANLSRATLLMANLSGANLKGAELTGAELSGANLFGADLSGGNLTGAKLIEANLDHAYLRGAKLIDAKLTEAQLSEAQLSNADLRRASLNLANLCGADLSDADLSGADLSNANLKRANLKGAELNGANLSSSNLLRTLGFVGLVQEQLDTACGDQKTTLPPGITLLRICSDP